VAGPPKKEGSSEGNKSVGRATGESRHLQKKEGRGVVKEKWGKGEGRKTKERESGRL